ncbi:MAG: FHA domain-containing protein [Deltaproteobacteria bacterium]|nr:FHA domain-containing protein [Deltaproteobacteria bacterium]
MSEPVEPASGVVRGLVPALMGVAVLAVPGLPDTAKAAAAFLLALVGAWLTATAGRTRLAAVEGRFVPPDPAQRTATVQAARPAPTPADRVQTPLQDVPPMMAPVAPLATRAPSAPTGGPTPTAAGPDAVYLGPHADPAFPAWQLHWQLRDGRNGVVPLPMGAQIRLGRHSESDVVVASDEVSRTHLLFSVTRATVAVSDAQSGNGTWHRKGEGVWDRMPPHAAVALQAWDQLRISDPWAIVLTLEPAGH